MNSSSNPFHRRVDHSSAYVASADGPLSDLHNDISDPAVRSQPKPSKTKKQKQVRISSPRRTPSPRNYYDTGTYSSGAYHDEPIAQHRSFQGPRTSRDGYSRRRGSSSSSSSDGDDDTAMAATMAEQRSPPPSSRPHNPFSRTLADMEESIGARDVERPPERAESSSSQPTQERGNPRATMDVDAFKTLLMTGKTGTNTEKELPPPAAHRTAAFTQADNSSSTDTSSISRHSIMDNVAHETPRSSYERSLSDEEEGDESVPQRTQSKRVKPPLPRHRHGKSVSGPRIVAFDDFTKTGQEQEPSSPVEDRSKSRTSAEMKRPLPPVPGPRGGAMKEALASASREQSRDPTPSPDVTERPPSQSKKPPPPPLARRSSQRTPVPSLERTRSSASVSRPSMTDDNISIAESTTSSTQIAPPPPPTRRSGGHSSHPANEGSPASLNRAPSLKSPPPPPTRNRASSNLSSTSIPPSSLVMTPSASSNSNQPPKPPPPRRTSSRSSIEIMSPRRTSGEMIRSSFDSDRRPSFSSSIRRVPITEEPVQDESAVETSRSASITGGAGGGKNILADMDAFQREIDALMAKDELGKRKSSSGSANAGP